MIPLPALRAATSALGIFGKAIPLPWIIVAAMGLLSAFLYNRNLVTHEQLEKVSWALAVEEKHAKQAMGRADQATQALQEAMTANKALQRAYDRLRTSANKKTQEASTKASQGAVGACRDAYDTIHRSLYD